MPRYRRPITRSHTVYLSVGELEDVEVTVEVEGRWVEAHTYGPPENCHPAESPDAEVTAAEHEGKDVLELLSESELAYARERALDSDASDDADDERYGPDPDDAYERARERRLGWDD